MHPPTQVYKIGRNSYCYLKAFTLRNIRVKFHQPTSFGCEDIVRRKMPLPLPFPILPINVDVLTTDPQIIRSLDPHVLMSSDP